MLTPRTNRGGATQKSEIPGGLWVLLYDSCRSCSMPPRRMPAEARETMANFGKPEAAGDDDDDETGVLQIESSTPGRPRRRGLSALLDGRNLYGQVRTSLQQRSGGSLLERCFGMLRGQLIEGEEHDEEPLLFALTWAQPQRYGIAPSPRNGHTMVLIGMHLYIFGGSDDVMSFNDVHTFHSGNMTWEKPTVHGTLPSQRSRHSATAVGNNMVVFGGVLQ
jgi:hypothetical protein